MLKYLFAALFVTVLGGALMLAFWPIPAPSQPTEVEISHDRFKL